MFDYFVTLLNVEFCAVLSSTDVKFSKVQLVLLFFLERLKVTVCCCLGVAFYFLLLKLDEFVTLFGKVCQFLPMSRFFIVVFFYLTFELENLLLKLRTVLTSVTAF